MCLLYCLYLMITQPLFLSHDQFLIYCIGDKSERAITANALLAAMRSSSTQQSLQENETVGEMKISEDGDSGGTEQHNVDSRLTKGEQSSSVAIRSPMDVRDRNCLFRAFLLKCLPPPCLHNTFAPRSAPPNETLLY